MEYYILLILDVEICINLRQIRKFLLSFEQKYRIFLINCNKTLKTHEHIGFINKKAHLLQFI